MNGLNTKKKEGKVGEMEGVNHFSMLEHGRFGRGVLGQLSFFKKLFSLLSLFFIFILVGWGILPRY